jgi:nucleolar protein 12
MNCYILFDTKEEAEAACGENNSEFLGKYLRVSLANQKEHDTKTTIFVGNLYYKAKEEEVRDHFKDCGEIHTIRIIRDPITHMGKGFAYIRFASKQGYLQGLKMNMSEFMTRQLRVKRAVDIEEENKKRDTIKQNEREKYALFGKRKHEPEPMLTETQKAEDVKMHEFSKSRNMEDQMTPDRASEIYKTKGKVPQNQIRGQLKKIKKLGVRYFYI